MLARRQVPDLTVQHVTTYEQVLDTMQAGQKTRATASTNMNQHSSRSHFMLQVFVASTVRADTFSHKNMSQSVLTWH